MQLTTEDGIEQVEPSTSQLSAALSRLGLPGNGFAILSKAEQYYIQTSGSRADGYIIEYRNGSEKEHYTSVRSDISQTEMVAAFEAYRVGGNWRSTIEWSNGLHKANNRSSTKKSNDNGITWLLALFFIIGAISISISIYQTIKRQQFLQRAVEVPGTVVKMVQRGNTYAPIVEYRDREGRAHILHTSLSSNPPSFYTSEKVVVVYDPTDVDFPLSAKIRTFGELWSVVLFAGVFGCFFIGISSACWVIFRRRTGTSHVK